MREVNLKATIYFRVDLDCIGEEGKSVPEFDAFDLRHDLEFELCESVTANAGEPDFIQYEVLEGEQI